jgi:hypothetical protein
MNYDEEGALLSTGADVPEPVKYEREDYSAADEEKSGGMGRRRGRLN